MTDSRWILLPVSALLKRVPEGERPPGLRVSRDLLGGDGLRTVISRLLASELHNPDGPWHVLVRDQLGKVEYVALIAELEAGAGVMARWLSRGHPMGDPR